MKALACANIAVGSLCMIFSITGSLVLDLQDFWAFTLVMAALFIGAANIAWGTIKLGE